MASQFIMLSKPVILQKSFIIKYVLLLEENLYLMSIIFSFQHPGAYFSFGWFRSPPLDGAVSLQYDQLMWYFSAQYLENIQNNQCGTQLFFFRWKNTSGYATFSSPQSSVLSFWWKDSCQDCSGQVLYSIISKLVISNVFFGLRKL